MPAARNDVLAAAARNALFDLFGDASVPAPELQCQLRLLAALIQLQLRALEAESTPNTTS